MDELELVTVQKAASILGVHPNTIREWSKDGKLRTYRVGTRRDRRFNRNDILALIEGLDDQDNND